MGNPLKQQTGILKYLLIFGSILLLISILVNFSYKFIQMDNNLYDDYNKFTDESKTELLENYEYNEITSNRLLSFFNIFNNTRTIFVIIFVGVILFIMLIGKKHGLINKLKDYFQ